MTKLFRDIRSDPVNTALGCIILIFAVLMLGCASTPQGAAHAPLALTPKAICIPLRTWSKAEQVKLADALSGVPENSVLLTLEKDWERMRDSSRACAR